MNNENTDMSPKIQLTWEERLFWDAMILRRFNIVIADNCIRARRERSKEIDEKETSK